MRPQLFHDFSGHGINCFIAWFLKAKVYLSVLPQFSYESINFLPHS
ncbi:conserved hypothetical protein [delta proteobacterium NaphS2]|nr:conserved hypothetical protein [delta proteobacterium NaphS2]